MKLIEEAIKGKPYVYRILEILKLDINEQIKELIVFDLMQQSSAKIAYPVVYTHKKKGEGTVQLFRDFNV